MSLKGKKGKKERKRKREGNYPISASKTILQADSDTATKHFEGYVTEIIKRPVLSYVSEVCSYRHKRLCSYQYSEDFLKDSYPGYQRFFLARGEGFEAISRRGTVTQHRHADKGQY